MNKGMFIRLVLCACLSATALAAGFAASATALPSRKANRAQRLCSAPDPGEAACLGMRLISKSLSSADLRANAHRQAHELSSGITPKVTSKVVPGGYTPADLHSAYSLPTETAASATQTIGIVDAYNDPTAEADLNYYSRTFGLPECTAGNGCFRRINEQGKASPLPARDGEWASEISLDLQMAHAICQNCHIVLAEAASTSYGDLAAAFKAAAEAGATEISNSYGGPEPSQAGEMYSAWSRAGVVVTVSSGDCGYFNQACNGTPSANFPADSPLVLAVGGTSLVHSGGSWLSSAWSSGGSGCSHVLSAAAWQSSAHGFSAAGCGGKRSVADVSAVGDPYTGVDVYDTTPAASGDPTGWGVWGGTSASSPIVAAEWALGGGARGVSYPAITLYSHLGESSLLYDVASGSNGSCSGTTSCRAASGYDGPTGVGSPIGLGAFNVSGTPKAGNTPPVSGTLEKGETLTAGLTGWSNEPTAETTQWVLCNASGTGCSAVAGATGETFPLGSGAVGKTVRLVSGASNGAGIGTAVWSEPTGVVVSNVPAVTSFTPSSAITGSTVTITGTGFTHVTAVTCGGASASFTIISPTEIEATVPSGTTIGAVVVVAKPGRGKSTAKFSPTLSVTGSTPGRATVGTRVTVNGVGFTAGAKIYFNGVEAETTYVSPTTLKTVVPPGASTGRITVAGEAGSVSSAGSFVVH